MREIKFELIFPANEILIGKTLNTNGHWIARRITSLGGKVVRFTVIQDDVDVISSTIREAMKRSDVIIVSGGLGPTFDDKTLQGLGRAIDRPLRLDKKAFRMIQEKYSKIQEMGVIKDAIITDHRKKMAMLPEGSIPLVNPVGSAPGVYTEHQGTRIICLPGVPSEFKAIFEGSIIPILREALRGVIFAEESFVLEEIVESEVAPLIEEVMKKNPYVYIKSHPLGYEGISKLVIHITATGGEEAERMVREVSNILKKELVIRGGRIKEDL
ncbi:MAG: molybdopterin-binding protein [Candidatus Hodarchaeota archaeon]